MADRRSWAAFLLFEESLFRSGENQEQTINDVSVVASQINNPDFLELLKNQTILLDWNYLPIVVEGQNTTYKFSDIAEQWEIDMRKSRMKHYFPCDEGSFSLGKSPCIARGYGFKSYQHPTLNKA